MNPTQLQATIREHLSFGRETAAVDQLIETFLTWFETGDRHLADEYMETTPTHEMTVTLLIAPLALTCPLHRVLESRADYFTRVQKRLQDVAPLQAESLLEGLCCP